MCQAHYNTCIVSFNFMTMWEGEYLCHFSSVAEETQSEVLCDLSNSQSVRIKPEFKS